MEVSKCWKIVKSPKTFNYNEKLKKRSMRPKQWASLNKLLCLPPSSTPPDKILLRLWNKNFLNYIYRIIQTFAFKMLQECSSWVSRICAVQTFFLTKKEKHFAVKLVKWERFVAVFQEHIIFSVNRVEVHKMSEVFWTKLYCKISNIYQ